MLGDGVARLGPEDVIEAGLGGALVAQFFKESQRIDDFPAGVGVDDDIRFILRRHLGGTAVPFEDAAVKGVDLLEEGDFELKSGFNDRFADEFTELGHDDLIGFLDGVNRARGDEKKDEESDGDKAAES